MQTWQYQLKTAITDPAELLDLLKLPAALLPAARQAARLFPLRVTRNFAARMRPGDPEDPLLRQVLPLGIEAAPQDGFTKDPLKEAAVNPVPGLLHKYHGRALLTVTGACAVHCRYCFRRHFPYAENTHSGWDEALRYIAQDASIREVILSGGDPLAARDDTLAELALQLATIAHVKILRIHSRMPIMLPERVGPSLVQWLTATRLKPVMVIHANHANEIEDGVRAAMRMFAKAGVVLLNQSVLLKGVNDSVAALSDLSWALSDAGVMPYYLHLLDRVQGAAHFEVDEPAALTLHRQLRARLPGYLVPKLVREVPGEPAKLPLI